MLAPVHFADLVWLPGIAGAIGGLITGVVASLLAPWSQWGVEKRRLQLEERRTMLEAVRKLIPLLVDARSFRDTPEYSRVRPYLSDKLRKDLEGEAVVVVVGQGRGNLAIWLLDEITQLEKKWRIV